MEKKKLFQFLGISLIGLLFVNLTFVSALIIFNNYGKITLYPGEDYILNIPFIGKTNNPTICGTAELNNGSLLQGVKVIASNSSESWEDTTDSDGKFCISLPEISGNYKKYNISIDYDNSTNGFYLGNNSYTLDFEDDIVYNKTEETLVFLTGTITNEDAEIDDGRIEIKIGYIENASSNTADYKRYGDKYIIFNTLNINSNEEYELTKDSNISWVMPIGDAPVGKYKMLIKTSFNGVEKSDYIYFNITE